MPLKDITYEILLGKFSIAYWFLFCKYYLHSNLWHHRSKTQSSHSLGALRDTPCFFLFSLRLHLPPAAARLNQLTAATHLLKYGFIALISMWNIKKYRHPKGYLYFLAPQTGLDSRCATQLGHSRLWQSTGLSFTTAPTSSPVFLKIYSLNAKHQPQGLVLCIWRLKQDSNLWHHRSKT